MADLSHELLEWVRSRYFGKYRGTVVDNADSTGRARLQVEVPAVLGDLHVWAMPCVPYAGDGVGFFALPDAGTGVWVEFEGGDPSFPIWTGCFWGDGQVPASPAAASVKMWKTGAVTLTIDDDAGELVVENQDGSTVTWSDEVRTEAGGSSHAVGSSGVASDGGGGTVDVTSSGVTISSGGSGAVDVTSASVSVNSGALEVM